MANVGFKIIDDLSKKVQKSKIILSSKQKETMALKRDGSLELLRSQEIAIEKLSDKSIYELIRPIKKNYREFEEEVKELWKKTTKIDDKNKPKNLSEHDLIKQLNGNPLCALLVSSNADGKLSSSCSRNFPP